MEFVKALMLTALVSGLALSNQLLAAEDNQITPGLQSVEVMHSGKKVMITRSSDKDAKIPGTFAKVARHCPPFCIQPGNAAAGVETVGELEVLGYLKRVGDGDRKVLVVDSRTPDWIIRGTIPGSINIPWNKINLELQGTFEVAAEADSLHDILISQLGVQEIEGNLDFRNAKTLVMFCNGIWCPQSSSNIKTLIKLGYPSYKLKWYRGGMQDWFSLGLTTVNH
ncbi:MAG: rhodanese-like domain-containing protein [Candidatus Thiodiazotropha sp. (ex Lucinoma aequizonata)]|nr:rhodanese-like domain-containing protein [Candidatus Thiodiazotropha sp. (ex Lucinoma aequizonata)]MCU7887033.1 rhodanese-like domain-containing protein [Candidatus Thiodiazotropha sp. (ex Lucinoma aequizonata)]MCU7895480.1 rhodanese-like domain-containing protein [Candidatus Thiodiazotropha sp. (ex Lucinoma aequizonata)]MCU7899057.1 rhodanese-like domain-containing protein [Candidatus Thiodiazotropha sp. (ex Lucinoma aequizonata)]MCU7902078.1 rhodanese-like domain-containing protein [Candid